MTLADADEVVGMEILSPGATILTITERGFGKRTPLDDYRLQRRGGRGVITIRTSSRNGKVVRVAQVVQEDEVMLITDGGKVLRCPVSGISQMGRATQGVRVMNLGSGEKLVAMARLAEADIERAVEQEASGVPVGVPVAVPVEVPVDPAAPVDDPAPAPDSTPDDESSS
jgi:DNA gyrase subunit A